MTQSPEEVAKALTRDQETVLLNFGKRDRRSFITAKYLIAAGDLIEIGALQLVSANNFRITPLGLRVAALLKEESNND